ncbi:hypothetical protein [Ralstonia pseudosolanacearum]
MSDQESKPSPASAIQNLRNKFHSSTEQENGLYAHYSPASCSIKEGVAKIVALLKLPNLDSITTKLNPKGGIDILKLNFKSALEASKKETCEARSRTTTKFKYRKI